MRHSPARVGDHFNVLYRYEPRRTITDVETPGRKADMRPVSLRVDCIHAYDKSLKELGPMMVGSLALSGTGLEWLTPGWVLGHSE